MNIEFYKEKECLILKYTSESDWIDEILDASDDNDEEIVLAKTFTFQKNDLVNNILSEGYHFKFGEKKGDYYKVERRKIGTKFDLYVNVNLDIDYSWFYCTIPTAKFKNKKGEERRTTKYGVLLHCFKDFYKQESLYFDADSYSDTDESGIHITHEKYKRFIEKFPTATNAKYYKLATFTDMLKDELSVEDYGKTYNEYLEKTRSKKIDYKSIVPNESIENDIAKYLYIKESLTTLLKETESGKSIHEDDFTRKIVEIFTILNPKYIKVVEKINIVDFTGARKTCQCDIALIDYDGNIDLIEVKHPTRYPTLFRSGAYRNHYIPCGELNGCINQLQQYLKSLTKMSNIDLNNKNKDIVASLEIEIKAVHPRGYVIFGRDTDSFSGTEKEKQQKRIDFEIINNMYNDVIDIITFDELLNRVDRIITYLSLVKVLKTD